MNEAPWIFLVVVLIACVGLAVYGSIARLQQRDELREHGSRVIATVTKVERAYRPTGHGGYHVYHLEAAWTDPQTGLSRTFTSEALLRQPRFQVNEGVPVWIDRNDPSRYALDL